MTTYNITLQHYKTLDIVGKSKSFSKLTLNELINYFQYIQHIEIDCKDNKELALDYLSKRYSWNIESRLKDLDKAWDTLQEQQKQIDCISNTIKASKVEDHSIFIDDNEEEKYLNISMQSNNHINTNDELIVNTDIPILFKSISLHKSMLLCQLDDENLQFQGTHEMYSISFYIKFQFKS